MRLNVGVISLECLQVFYRFKSLWRYQRPGYTWCCFGHNSSSGF